MESENRRLDVINVAGLMIGKWHEDSLEKALRDQEYVRSVVTIYPTPASKSRENPEESIMRAIGQVDEEVTKIISEFGEGNIVLVGQSYGALMALMVACRTKFKNILKVVLMEGSLHPEVTVEPPRLLPVLAVCASHYQARPRIANEAVCSLKELGTDRVVIITNRRDGVVSPEAQILPGNFQEIELDTENLDVFGKVDNTRGMIIRLPRHLGGKDTGLTSLLPKEYRDHLAWSDEKCKFIGEIIRVTTERAIEEKIVRPGKPVGLANTHERSECAYNQA